MPLLQILMICKNSDVYSWEIDGMTTALREVPLLVECIWKIHIVETGHVYASFIVHENHFEEWCSEDNRRSNSNHNHLLFWVLWVWASLVHHLPFISSPFNINVVESAFLHANACSPNSKLSNSGRPIGSYDTRNTTFKDSTWGFIEGRNTEFRTLELGQIYLLLQRSSHTLQFQWSIIEVVTIRINIVPVTHLYRFQSTHISNQTLLVTGKGE